VLDIQLDSHTILDVPLILELSTVAHLGTWKQPQRGGSGHGSGRDTPPCLPLVLKFPCLLFHLQDTSAGRRTEDLSMSPEGLWRRFCKGEARNVLVDRFVTVPWEPCAILQSIRLPRCLETVIRQQINPALPAQTELPWLSTSTSVLLPRSCLVLDP
jgi:hypothetical protein